VAVETLDVRWLVAEELLGKLGRRLAEASQDTRVKSFLRQLVDVAVQRGNAFQPWALFLSLRWIWTRL